MDVTPMEVSPMDAAMDCCESRTSTTRRSLLLGGASFAAWAYLPKFARAADGRDPRLVVVILRGALDGLAPKRIEQAEIGGGGRQLGHDGFRDEKRR